MGRYNNLLIRFKQAITRLERLEFLRSLPKLPYLVLSEDGTDLPGYAEHNALHAQASQELRIPPKEYVGFDPSEEGQDDRPEFTEWEGEGLSFPGNPDNWKE